MNLPAPAYCPADRNTMCVNETNPVVRFFRPGDESGIARLFLDVYGRTYHYPEVYDPCHMRECVRQGKFISAVIAGKDDAILGHCALIRNDTESKTMNIGLSVVDRRFRHRNLEAQLLRFLIDFAQRNKIAGIFSVALTHHPFAQMAGEKLGFRRMGLYVGYLPGTRIIDGIHVNEGRRQSGMAGYISLGSNTGNILHLPAHHEDFIKAILDNAGLRRPISRVAAANIPHNDFSFSIQRFPVDNRAIIRVFRYGPDLKTRIRGLLRSMIDENIQHFIVHFRLSDPFAEKACRICEDLGFFIGGIQPLSPIGDSFFLQYLHNISVNYNDILVASDMGACIKSYVQSHHIHGSGRIKFFN